VSGQFKVGDVVKIVREPFYRSGDTKWDVDFPIGTVGRITNYVDSDGDVELSSISDKDDFLCDVSTECIELVDAVNEDNLVITDAVIIDRLADIRGVAKTYVADQFFYVTTASMSSNKMKPDDMEAHLTLFFIDVLAKLKEDDGTV
jgi:hypothetical protein